MMGPPSMDDESLSLALSAIVVGADLRARTDGDLTNNTSFGTARQPRSAAAQGRRVSAHGASDNDEERFAPTYRKCEHPLWSVRPVADVGRRCTNGREERRAVGHRRESRKGRMPQVRGKRELLPCTSKTKIIKIIKRTFNSAIEFGNSYITSKWWKTFVPRLHCPVPAAAAAPFIPETL